MNTTKEPWPCMIAVEATHADGRRRRVEVHYEGGGDPHGLGAAALRKRLRKPYLWDGTEYTIVTGLGQVMRGTFENGEQP